MSRPGDFVGAIGSRSSAVEHHVTVAQLLDPKDGNRFSSLYIGLQATDPSTNRSYFSVSNRSDNKIDLLPSQGQGIYDVNASIIHANNHPSYTQFIKSEVH